MIFDTHSHCYWHNLEPHLKEILQKMQENGVVKATQIGCDIKTSRQALALAKKFPNIFYATVGLHPETSQNMSEWRAFFNMDKYTSFDDFLEEILQKNADFWNEIFLKIPLFQEFETMIVEHEKSVVAIGECGFDFHYLDGTNDGKNSMNWEQISEKAKTQIENQKFWWLAQWKLAKKYDFPLVIHTRDARDITIEFMKKCNISRVVMHCYSEDVTMAQELLDFSDEIYFSFSGIVTYKNAKSIQETAQFVPVDCILVETDSPFLAPVPVRGTINNPSNTRFVLEKIAELRGEKVENLEDKIYKNSLRFYEIEQ